jgi:hypothetical protein
MHSLAQALRSGQQRPMQNIAMATAQIETEVRAARCPVMVVREKEHDFL